MRALERLYQARRAGATGLPQVRANLVLAPPPSQMEISEKNEIWQFVTDILLILQDFRASDAISSPETSKARSMV